MNCKRWQPVKRDKTAKKRQGKRRKPVVIRESDSFRQSFAIEGTHGGIVANEWTARGQGKQEKPLSPSTQWGGGFMLFFPGFPSGLTGFCRPCRSLCAAWRFICGRQPNGPPQKAERAGSSCKSRSHGNDMDTVGLPCGRSRRWNPFRDERRRRPALANPRFTKLSWRRASAHTHTRSAQLGKSAPRTKWQVSAVPPDVATATNQKTPLEIPQPDTTTFQVQGRRRSR